MAETMAAKPADGAGDDSYVSNPVVLDLRGPIDTSTARRITHSLAVIAHRDVLLRIDSPGGSVVAGLAILLALVRHPGRVVALVYGRADSMAAVVAAVADEVRVTPVSSMLLHNPRASGCASAETIELVNAAGVLFSQLFALRTSIPWDHMRAWLAEEVAFDAASALAVGLADSLDVACKVVVWRAAGDTGIRRRLGVQSYILGGPHG